MGLRQCCSSTLSHCILFSRFLGFLLHESQVRALFFFLCVINKRKVLCCDFYQDLLEFHLHLAVALQAGGELQLSERFRGNASTPHITQIHPSCHPALLSLCVKFKCCLEEGSQQSVAPVSWLWQKHEKYMCFCIVKV